MTSIERAEQVLGRKLKHREIVLINTIYDENRFEMYVHNGGLALKKKEKK
ncbi:hypothetical protein [Empedobacter brevis]|nr:hypothetical protein [Empedobacter brevis]